MTPQAQRLETLVRSTCYRTVVLEQNPPVCGGSRTTTAKS